MKKISNLSQVTFEGKVLSALFKKFNIAKLRYAVLRDFEFLPNRLGSRDLDILIHPSDMPLACRIVANIALSMDLQFGNYFFDERIVQFTLVGRGLHKSLLQIKIDFFTRNDVYGIEVLSAEVMLLNLRTHNGVLVVADYIMLLDKLIFHLLVNQPLRSKYDADFALIARSRGKELKQILTKFLSAEKTKTLIVGLAKGSGSTLSLTRNERLLTLSRLWVGQRILIVPRSLKFLNFRLRDRIRLHGIFISISGPDGSGKTTIIDSVITQLNTLYGEGQVHYEHFRPTILPRIAEVAKMANVVKHIDENYERPHRASAAGLIGSMARLGYYWLDYLYGYLRKVRPEIKKGKLILFDRYYYDMIADSLRSRILLPQLLLRALGRILPLPDYAFFIKVDPNEIYRRKQELTMKRIVTLNSHYEDLVERGWLIEVDNNGAPEKAATEIVDYIITQRHLKSMRNLR